MQDSLTLNPIKRVNGCLTLPGSKSISNRALLLSAQATGVTRLTNLLNSEDVSYMLTALNRLGINYHLSVDNYNCEVNGIGGPINTNSARKLFLGNSGTAMRLLTSALCLNKNDITLIGDLRMKKRPIGHLVDALRQGGAKICYLEQDGYPPLRLYGGYQGGNITINSSVSSQFLTSLLMMAPMAPKNSCIRIKSKLVSKPYIDITIALMRSFGIKIIHHNYEVFYIVGNSFYHSPGDYLVEGDASSASYFLAAAAIRGGTVRVNGINCNSIQGDIYFANVLKNMGAIINWGNNYIECSRSTLRAINIDVNHIPDAAMTIAITALFTNGGTTTLRNIANWRVKETDRLTAMATELSKLGALVVEGKDYLSITPPTMLNTVSINTYNDHRIAMCFALVALSNVSVTILNPQCIRKTFPNFFILLSTLSVLT